MMKLNAFKLVVSYLVIFISGHTLAQNFQGEAYYFSKTSIDMSNFGGREMNEDMKKRIAERMKSMFEKTYVLTFNKEESSYKEEEALEAPGQAGGGFRMMMGSFTGGTQYKNVKSQKMLQEQEFFGKQFLVNDTLQKLEWKLGSETKQIGKYLCMKATAVKPVSETDFNSMRRRGNNRDVEAKEKDSTKTTAITDEIEVPKEIEVTAWYTPQIPISQGPADYWGLPGLILEINADRTTILCSKIIINPAEKEEIKIPSKGKEVTQKEYNTIIKKKMEEMREMRGGRNQREHIRIRG